MKKRPLSYEQVLKRFHSLVMVVLLVWLTVSLPYINAVQQDVLTAQGIIEDQGADPFSGSGEEKVETGNGASLSEYLHDLYLHAYAALPGITVYKCHTDIYCSAFPPDLISPPPEWLA